MEGEKRAAGSEWLVARNDRGVASHAPRAAPIPWEDNHAPTHPDLRL
jgi:hypothetical protein